MKRKLLIAFTVLLFTPLINAQVLFTENFENYTLGNLGTDPTGIISRQGRLVSKFFATD